MDVKLEQTKGHRISSDEMREIAKRNKRMKKPIGTWPKKEQTAEKRMVLFLDENGPELLPTHMLKAMKKNNQTTDKLMAW